MAHTMEMICLMYYLMKYTWWNVMWIDFPTSDAQLIEQDELVKVLLEDAQQCLDLDWHALLV